MGVIACESVCVHMRVRDASEKGQGGETGSWLRGSRYPAVCVKFHRSVLERDDASTPVQGNVTPLRGTLSKTVFSFTATWSAAA